MGQNGIYASATYENGMSADDYFQAWTHALVFTLAVETPIYMLLAPRFADNKRSLLIWLSVGLSASLITHPFVWYAWPEIIDATQHYTAFLVAAELFAVLVEAAWLRLWSVRLAPALLISIAANMSSVAVGEVTRALFGWP